MKKDKAKVTWEIVCLPKNEGGLGIRSLEKWNIALMTTHIWNSLMRKDSLWVNWINEYRLKECSFWQVRIRADADWGWRKLLRIRDTIRPCIYSRLGDGLNTSAWFDFGMIKVRGGSSLPAETFT